MRGQRIYDDSPPEYMPPGDLDGTAAPERQAWLDHVERIHTYLLKDLTIRLGRQDAEDVLQEFYLRVLRYRPHLEGEASVRSFIYRILRSVVADHFRRLAVQTKVAVAIESHWEAPVSDEPGESAVYDHLQGLIGELPRQYATLIKRVDIDDESRSEVAANLGITTNNLAVRLLRARSALRSRAIAFPISALNRGSEDRLCSSTQRAVSLKDCVRPERNGAVRINTRV